jgi:hypothetical protein
VSEPIYQPGPQPAPVVYEASGTGPIIPLACYAEFDGTLAVGAFKPVLIFKSQAGHTFMQAATDETVAAGASAAVSWFPRVGAAAAAATATGVEWFWAKRETNATVNAGSDYRVVWVSAKTSPASGMALSTFSVANDTISCTKAGVYMVTVRANPTAPANYAVSTYINSDNMVNLGFSAGNFLTDANTDNTPAGNHNLPTESGMLVTTAVPADVYQIVHNYSAANHTLAAAYIGIAYLPNATLWA